MNIGIATAGKGIGVSIWVVVLILAALFVAGYVCGMKSSILKKFKDHWR